MQNQRKIISSGEPVIVFEGKLGAIVSYPMLVDNGDGYKERNFERFVRPPGARIIAIKDKKIFLQKEHRLETTNEFDWRLPGGKVVDTFLEYKQYLNKDIPEEIILEAGRRELKEEASMDSDFVRIYKKSSCGASVAWDLYYIIAENTFPCDTVHHEAEEIIAGQWFTYSEVLEMCLDGSIDEDRSVAVLHQFIDQA